MTRVSDFRFQIKSEKIRNSSSSYLQQETNLIKHVEGEILDILNAASTISVLFMRERDHPARRSQLHLLSKSHIGHATVLNRNTREISVHTLATHTPENYSKIPSVLLMQQRNSE